MLKGRPQNSVPLVKILLSSVKDAFSEKMDDMEKIKSSLYLGAVWLCLMAFQPLDASSYQIWAQTANSVGYAHADMAALADDSSTAWYNPAGMTKLCSPEMSLSGTFIDLRTRFSGQTGFATQLDTIAYLDGNLFGVFTDMVNLPFRTALAKGNSNPALGGLNAVYPIHCSDFTIAFGLAIDAPWGLETDWQSSSVATYAARSSIESIQINPSVAFAYGPLSIGVGYGSELVRTQFSSDFVNSSGFVTLKNWENTWNIGALYTFSPSTQVGITYRPGVDHHLKGHSHILFTRSNSASCLFKLPDTITLGFKQEINPCWTVLGTVAWSRWSRVKGIDVSTGINLITPELAIIEPELLVIYSALPTITFQGSNTYFVALGSKYVVDEHWTVKCGFAWDQSPIKNRYREFRIPDNDHYHVALGARCDFNECVRMDAGLQYVYVPKCRVQNVPIVPVPITATRDGVIDNGLTNVPIPARGYSGSIESSAIVFSIQASVIFP